MIFISYSFHISRGSRLCIFLGSALLFKSKTCDSKNEPCCKQNQHYSNTGSRDKLNSNKSNDSNKHVMNSNHNKNDSNK